MRPSASATSTASDDATLPHVPPPPPPHRQFVIRRLRCRASNVLVAASLLLFVAIAGGWAASRFRTDIVFASIGPDHSFLLAESGGEFLAGTCDQSPDGHVNGPGSSIHVSHMAGAANRYGLGQVMWLLMFGDRQSTGWVRAGFGYVAQTDAMPGERTARAIVWPHWSALLVTSVLPLAWVVRRRLERTRRREGLCRQCGYDLRASPSTCPECGTTASGTAPMAGRPAA